MLRAEAGLTSEYIAAVEFIGPRALLLFLAPSPWLARAGCVTYSDLMHSRNKLYYRVAYVAVLLLMHRELQQHRCMRLLAE